MTPRRASGEPTFFVLGEDGRTPVETDFAGWLEWAETNGGPARTVARDEAEGHLVSTVFIAQFRFGHDPVLPWHFETLVDDGDACRVAGRYAPVEEAEKGHADAVAAFPSLRKT